MLPAGVPDVAAADAAAAVAAAAAKQRGNLVAIVLAPVDLWTARLVDSRRKKTAVPETCPTDAAHVTALSTAVCTKQPRNGT